MEEKTLIIRKVEYKDISLILHSLCWEIKSKERLTKDDPKQKHLPHEYWKVVVQRDEARIKDLDAIHQTDERVLKLLEERDEQPQRYIRPLFDRDKRTLFLLACALGGLIMIIVFLIKFIKALGATPIIPSAVIINILLILIGFFLIGITISGVFDTIQIQKNSLADNKKLPGVKEIDIKIEEELNQIKTISDKYWEQIQE
ncbi:MAG: hypothetical protein ACOX56_06420 [Acholeplasmataceae bacterium]|jgi:uncharacterized membrane protein (DUF485 family)